MSNRYFQEAKNAPGSGAWQALKGAYHWWMSKSGLGGNPRIPLRTGMAPDVTPGKALKAVSKAAKLANQTAKEDRAYNISRKVKTQYKQSKAFTTGDRRAVASGQNRVQNSQIRLALEQMKDPTYNASYARELNKLEVKMAKYSDPAKQAELKAQMRDLAKRFIEEGWLH